MKLVIIGAGPIGLDAALKARLKGWDVSLFEAGTRIASNVRSWGHVRLFTPWSLNTSPQGREVIRGAGGVVPDSAVCPTGHGYCEEYLEPLAKLLGARGVDVRLDTDVVAIGRGRLLKAEHIGDATRARAPFRVFIEDEGGESVESADVLCDCSGVLDGPNFVGSAGSPAIGEAECDDRIVRRIPNIGGIEGSRFAHKRVMVLGSGLSAATTISALLKLRQEAPATEVLWVRREEGAPYSVIHQDPLPSRERLAQEGNEAAEGKLPVNAIGGAGIYSLRMTPRGRLGVTLDDKGGERWEEVVDELIANVGYRPNTALFEELQVHQCYATQGPMKIAASLLANREQAGDCLAQPSLDTELLVNPEPGFFVLGAKSYGRNPDFLLRAGFEQVDSVMTLLSERAATTT